MIFQSKFFFRFSIAVKNPTFISSVRFLVIVYLLMNSKKMNLYLENKIGQRFLIYLCFHSAGRFLIEFLRGDDRGRYIKAFQSRNRSALVY